MALLDATNRFRTCAQLMRGRVLGAVTGLTKADLQAAVDATDTWIENNQSSYNVAIPQPARNNLTLTQKTLIFCYVAMRRAGILRTEEDG